MSGLSSQEIAALERDLGCVLPADVRAKYSEADGLLGPTNCSFLYPYRMPANTQVVQINVLARADDWVPDSLAEIVILGDDGCGNYLCLSPSEGSAILWNPADGDWVQERVPSMTALWAHVERFYASVA